MGKGVPTSKRGLDKYNEPTFILPFPFPNNYQNQLPMLHLVSYFNIDFYLFRRSMTIAKTS
jgi:hypothetical protein